MDRLIFIMGGRIQHKLDCFLYPPGVKEEGGVEELQVEGDVVPGHVLREVLVQLPGQLLLAQQTLELGPPLRLHQ